MSKKISRCYACNGSKSIVGLGNMLQSCKACNGVGYSNDIVKEEDLIEEQEELINVLPIKKRPGRKPGKK